jgi:hypothetical protein
MENPDSLTTEQPNARPKDSSSRNQFRCPPKPEIEARKGDKYWSFQAHHAIPGNQSLKGHSVEAFIKKSGGKIVRDTGYSINNSSNGVWLPSYPEQFRGQWKNRDPKKKQRSANHAMKKFKAQFHCGHHDIEIDADQLDRRTYKNYVDYVKRRLETLNGAIKRWEKVCPNKSPQSDKHYGNILIHNALDGLSRAIIGRLRGTPRRWRFFVSRYAMNFKNKVDTY